MRSWIELEVNVEARWADAVSSFLFDLGTTGTEVEDPGQVVIIRAYFEPSGELDLGDVVERYLRALGSRKHRVLERRLEHAPWEESWKEWFTPLAAGKRLWVHPPWSSDVPPGRIAIVIEPGMAFGTGHHASTLGCLELIEANLAGQIVERALDLGTGSGILAIAMAKLGVPHIDAVDIDPTALAVARENARRNQVTPLVHFHDRWPEDHARYDLIAANLYRKVLEDLAAQIVAALKPGGVFICAGLLTSDEAAVGALYGHLGLVLHNRWEQSDWIALSYRKAWP
ncbi:MAG: 50S ribosomal protein L11 methyltransferase [Candidatus Binatia bacterium]|nr:MAG: 50S ribosomal protein L11 methyltransferase [Candidatus Binatia bacterium]